MPTTFPAGLDAFPNPGSATLEDAAGFYHDEQHANANDAIEAIEGKLGISETVPADAPAANTVLASSATGRSKWRPILSSDFAAGAAYVKVAEVVASGSPLALQALSIPSTYRHLRVTHELRSAGAGTTFRPILMRIGYSGAFVTASTYDWQQLSAFGASSASAEGMGQGGWQVGFAPGAGHVADLASHGEIILPYYTDATFVASFYGRTIQFLGATYGATGGFSLANVGGHLRTARGAIDRIEVFCSDFSALVNGSKLTVWGVPA